MKRFKKVYIEITNICNLSCSFCPKTERLQSFMDEASFRHVIDEIKPFTDYVYFHLMGEPLLNPSVGRFLEICEAQELKVNITTNGTLLAEVKDVLIRASSLRQINISLSSFEANANDGDLETYIDNIAEFIREANEKSQIICSMRLWNMDSGDLKGSNSENLRIMSMLEEKLELGYSISERLKNSLQLKLKNNVYLNLAQRFEWPDMDKASESPKVFCYGLRDQIGILVDGTVVPCCLDSEGSIPLGNILASSLESILYSQKARRIYEGFSRRCAVEELCKRCGYAKRH